MPKRILIIGILFCLSGLNSIYEFVVGVFNDHLFINFGILMLPVGIGIFKGKNSSQWWARFWIILGYIMCLALMLSSLFMPSNAHAEWFGRRIEGGEAVPYLWMFSLVLLGVLILMHKLLYSERSMSYFKKQTWVQE